MNDPPKPYAAFESQSEMHSPDGVIRCGCDGIQLRKCIKVFCNAHFFITLSLFLGHLAKKIHSMKAQFIYLLILCSIPTCVVAQNYQLAPLFGDNGTVQLNIWAGDEHFNQHVLLPDGKLLLGGYGFWNSPNAFHLKMMRVDTACGQIDTDFGNDGLLSYTFEQRTKMLGMAVQEDLKIIGCGMSAPSNSGSQQRPVVFRFLENGTPDADFGEDGYFKPNFDAVSSGALLTAFVDGDGKITCVGTSTTNINGGTNRIGVMRFTDEGSYDTEFGNNGRVSVSLQSLGMSLWSSGQSGIGLLQDDGKIIAIGMGAIAGSYRIVMARFTDEGEVDDTFGDDGVYISDYTVTNSSFAEDGIGAALQEDGKILVCALTSSPSNMLMARHMPDGSLDTDYGDEGLSLVGIGSQALTSRRMNLLEDGSTLQFGAQNWNSGPPVIVKRSIDGAIDTDFGNNGIVTVPMSGTNDKAWNGFIADNGRLFVYGGKGSSGVFVSKLTTTPEFEFLVDLGEDLTFCEGESFTFDAGNEGSTYLWQDDSINQTFTATETETVMVIVTTEQGCTDQSSVEVTFVSLPSAPEIEFDGETSTLSTDATGALQWYLNDEVIKGATTNTILAEVDGTYTVEVTNSAGCSTLSDPFAVVSVSEVANTEIVIYPNPASSFVNISSTEEWERIEAISVSGAISPLVMNRNGMINVSSLANGSYILRFIGDHKIVTARLFKME